MGRTIDICYYEEKWFYCHHFLLVSPFTSVNEFRMPWIKYIFGLLYLFIHTSINSESIHNWIFLIEFTSLVNICFTYKLEDSQSATVNISRILEHLDPGSIAFCHDNILYFPLLLSQFVCCKWLMQVFRGACIVIYTKNFSHMFKSDAPF